MKSILWLHDIHPNHYETVGHKAAYLAKIISLGHLVPEGFVLTAETLRNKPRKTWEPLLKRSLEKLPKPWVARSSSNGEDSKEFSFPGLFKTVLGLTCTQAMADSIDDIVASLSSKAASSYYQFHGLRPNDFRMAVLVQHMLEPTISGVAFSRHPLNFKGTVAIESTYGLGTLLVDGTISPDLVEVDEEEHVHFSRVGSKHLKAIFGPEGVEFVPVNAEECLRPSISIRQAKELARLARRLEHELNEPQDIEWAIENMKTYLVQSRPITTFHKDGSL